MLLDLIKTKVSYVVQEAVIVIKDIFRKYPNKYESIIGTLCENLEDLDEPEAKASMIWIIGEYADRIDNADEGMASPISAICPISGAVIQPQPQPRRLPPSAHLPCIRIFAEPLYGERSRP